ncbi:MAG: hypothetical protein ACR2NZ_21695, partial [Rubripirellula sp.]
MQLRLKVYLYVCAALGCSVLFGDDRFIKESSELGNGATVSAVADAERAPSSAITRANADEVKPAAVKPAAGKPHAEGELVHSASRDAQRSAVSDGASEASADRVIRSGLSRP